MIVHLLPLILPLARRWVDAQQAKILADGVPLAAGELEDARVLGIADRARVRLKVVKAIPLPFEPMLRSVSGRTPLITGETTGITFGHGIYIRDDCWGDRRLVVHELVHVAQYERFGGTAGFLREYLRECVTVGYPHGPLEQEALRRTRELCG